MLTGAAARQLFRTLGRDSVAPRPISYMQKPGDSGVKRVTLIPGTGIGPEITQSVQHVLEAAHCPITWDTIQNFDFEKKESKLALRVNPTILLGSISQSMNNRENHKIYKSLDLYANIVHAYSLPNVTNRHKNVDIVIIRENTEGEYSGVEHEVYPGVVESLKIMTKPSLTRIAQYAFEYAYLAGRKKVTAVHKANIMKLADGLFLEACREIAQQYPFIKYEEMIIDNCAMQLVKNPLQFDVMVMPNLYGSIVQHIATGITGGPGLTAGASIGRDFALFSQGCRRKGKDIAGQNIANPSALLFASVLMLRNLGLPRFGDLIDSAVMKVLCEGKVKTRDIGGTHSTSHFTEEVTRVIKETLSAPRRTALTA